MGFPTKLQRINRKSSQQWYVNLPSAVAQAMDFTSGEIVEWAIEDRTQLVLNRPNAPASTLKKTPKTGSSISSKSSSARPSSTANPASPNASSDSP